MSPFDQYTVRKIKRDPARAFIALHHYAQGCHNGPMAWGLFLDDELVGVCAFATPCSENVRRSLFGSGTEAWVTELHRLAVLRPHPPNLTSWFVARAIAGLKAYRPEVRALISFADGTEGHVGTIYQALNFGYYGTTGRATFYLDEKGRLRHPRQCGKNIDKAEAKARGWTPTRRDAKHRYVLLLPRSRKEKRSLPARLLLTEQPYPTLEEIPR